MESSTIKKDPPKKRSPNQIEKDLLSLQKAILSDKKDMIDIKEDTIDKLLELARGQKENDIPLALQIKILKIKTLRETMGYCYGQGIFGAMQETMIKPVFNNEDDGLDFKAKLFELIKSL